MKLSITEMSRFWWWVLLCALVCSAVFNAFSYLIPRQNESGAVLNIAFDFSNSAYWNDKNMLTFIESLAPAFYAPKIIALVLDQAKSAGIELTETEFNQHTSAEQRFYGWVFTARFIDPETSQIIVNLWGEALLNAFQQDKTALISISQEQQDYQILIDCLEQVTVFPAHPTCQFENLPALQSKMRQLNQTYLLALEDLNYLPRVPAYFSFVLGGEMESPDMVQSTLKTSLPVVGAVFGILLGVITLANGTPQKLLKKVSPSPIEE